MRPADHPEFFRFPAPEGRSRESTIRVDRDGRFFHDGELVEHRGLARALASWVARHPDDGRYILTNGYDWTYFTVEDTPCFVHAVHVRPAGGSERRAVLELTDGSEEPLVPADTRMATDGSVTTLVKRAAPGGAFRARFQRPALVDLAELLEEAPSGHFRLQRALGGDEIPTG
ncbi:MAG: DUF1285 domain-containing protein [Polyangiaceae bacterium]